MPELIDNKTVFSLLEVTKSIQKTISDRYKSLYWIKAEMNKLNYYAHSGHCYPELVEKKEGKIVAEIRSVLWKTDYNRINQQFIRLFNEPLRDGVTILFQAGVSYDPLYGLSLRMVDIDPGFVLGELEKEKRESIFKLQQEGVFLLNKTRFFPIVPKRLAIISVETSKGLSDFYKIIRHNPWNYCIETTLFPALLQGDKSVPSIISQLAVIADRAESFDAVAIIRGGGGEVGLSSYNNYHLAKAIAIFPIPVLTGIGHSTNETVSEMVSYKNAITPSELADFLIQHFHQFAIPLIQLQESLLKGAERLFELEGNKLQSLSQSITWNSKRMLEQHHYNVTGLSRELKQLSIQYLKENRTTLDHLNRLMVLADPKQLLKRGFSISRVNGKVICSTEELEAGDIMVTELLEGQIVSTINRVNDGK